MWWWGYEERVIWVRVNVCRGNEFWEGAGYMGILWNRDCQLASRRVLKGFTDDALTILAGILFQKGTARMLNAYWQRRVQHLCWWNL